VEPRCLRSLWAKTTALEAAETPLIRFATRSWTKVEQEVLEGEQATRSPAELRMAEKHRR
jgi:hypothetical protein